MRYFSIILVVGLMALICLDFDNKNSLIFYVNYFNSTAKIIDCCDDFEVVKFNESECKMLLKKLSVELVSKKEIDDRIVIECYSNKLNKFLSINNKKINLQISIVDGECLVGYPLIKNSF